MNAQIVCIIILSSVDQLLERRNASNLKAIVDPTFIVDGIDDMHRTRNDAGRLLQVDDAL